MFLRTSFVVSLLISLVLSVQENHSDNHQQKYQENHSDNHQQKSPEIHSDNHQDKYQENHRVVVHHPYQHQQVISDSYIGLEYGIVKGNDKTPNEDVQIKFEWTHRNNTNTTTTPSLQLNVHQGFSTRVMGTHQQHYAYQWKTPSCPFFVRYQPLQYNFSLLFLIGDDTQAALNTSRIRIPLDFTVVNVTGLHCNNKMLNPPKHVHHHNNTSTTPKPTGKHQ